MECGLSQILSHLFVKLKSCHIYLLSMLSIGHTLISDLVVTNLFMHSLLGTIQLMSKFTKKHK